MRFGDSFDCPALVENPTLTTLFYCAAFSPEAGELPLIVASYEGLAGNGSQDARERERALKWAPSRADSPDRLCLLGSEAELRVRPLTR